MSDNRPAPAEAFVSPLVIPLQRPYDYLAFARLEMSAEMVQVQERMERQLLDCFASGLPAALVDEAQLLVKGYAAEYRNFFSLYYPFIWSFLYWLPREHSVTVPEELSRAHGLALFLHLWDDHLVDGQLRADPLRLQMRSLAWHCFQTDLDSLAATAGMGSDALAVYLHPYVESQVRPARYANVDAYLAGAFQQFSIWFAAPVLCGPLLSLGQEAAQALITILLDFTKVWRIVDDLADLDEDVRADNKNAVWLMLDRDGRDAWDRCCRLSPSQLDRDSFRRLVNRIELQNIKERLMESAQVCLGRALTEARQQAWWGMAGELNAMATRLDTLSAAL